MSSSIRERYRAQVRDEVKQAALAQLAQGGPGALSISAIGKQLGVSGPALYRYFASRDELLTELVIDAYDDLAGALADAAGEDRRGRLETVARAYRTWALAQPHRYRLLFGPPLPGYDAHAERIVAAAWASMKVLLDVIGEVGDGTGDDGLPQPLASQLATWARPYPAASPGAALRAVLAWSRLHGIVSLEIAGNFASMGLDAEQLFEVQLATLTA
jgi:AcrR family transcriptional regulator